MGESLVHYVVKAKLEDGSVVNLEKDCDCVLHDGPHWVYMDICDRQRTKKNIINRTPDISLELMRLNEKIRLFNQKRIIELILPFPYDDPRWSWFTYRQTINKSARTKEQVKYDEWLENFINRP